jgi:S-adenosylmethionine:diacylglycerol 3-amino-3-carboxypropyl transferase
MFRLDQLKLESVTNIDQQNETIRHLAQQNETISMTFKVSIYSTDIFRNPYWGQKETKGRREGQILVFREGGGLEN